jgi:hypothetical protein
MTDRDETPVKIFKSDEEFARVVSEHEFAGAKYLLLELVRGARGSLETAPADYLAGHVPASVAEWAMAVRIATRSEVERRKAEQARRDPDTYGFLVRTKSSDRTEDVRIVRASKTMLVDAKERVWKRSTGRRQHGKLGAPDITAISLAAIERFLDGREQVDIVAEFKRIEPGRDPSVDSAILNLDHDV